MCDMIEVTSEKRRLKSSRDRVRQDMSSAAAAMHLLGPAQDWRIRFVHSRLRIQDTGQGEVFKKINKSVYGPDTTTENRSINSAHLTARRQSLLSYQNSRRASTFAACHSCPLVLLPFAIYLSATGALSLSPLPVSIISLSHTSECLDLSRHTVYQTLY